MAPEVGEIVIDQRMVESYKMAQALITIQLGDSKPFDPVKFDDFFLNRRPFKWDTEFKFMVLDETVYVFPASAVHREVREQLKKLGIAGQLYCAGQGKVLVDRTKGLITKRLLTGTSNSLEFTLKPKDSDEFKNSVLQEELGQWFTID